MSPIWYFDSQYENLLGGVLMSTCNQCGKPAMCEISGHFLCLDCTHKFQQLNKSHMDDSFRYLNFLTDEMEAIAGVHGILPKFEIPKTVVHKGQINFNNINVEGSVVGAINTGNVQSIDVAMSHIHDNLGYTELAEALKEFTEEFINDKSIESDVKDEIIEQLSFLTEQVISPKEHQKSSIARTVLKSMKETMTNFASLTTLITSWEKLQTILGGLF